MPLSGNSFLCLYQEIYFYTCIRNSILFFRFSHFSFFYINLPSTDLFLFNKVKTTLLKTPQTLAAAQSPTDLETSFLLAGFHSAGKRAEATRREKTSVILPSTGPSMPQ